MYSYTQSDHVWSTREDGICALKLQDGTPVRIWTDPCRESLNSLRRSAQKTLSDMRNAFYRHVFLECWAKHTQGNANNALLRPRLWKTTALSWTDDRWHLNYLVRSHAKYSAVMGVNDFLLINNAQHFFFLRVTGVCFNKNAAHIFLKLNGSFCHSKKSHQAISQFRLNVRMLFSPSLNGFCERHWLKCSRVTLRDFYAQIGRDRTFHNFKNWPFLTMRP